jgi:hypothetical protein
LNTISTLGLKGNKEKANDIDVVFGNRKNTLRRPANSKV